MNFTDFPALFAFRSPDEPRELLQIGPIDPRRSTKIQTAYVRAFLDRHLRGKPTPLLDGPSRRYPEVRFSLEPPIALGGHDRCEQRGGLSRSHPSRQ